MKSPALFLSLGAALLFGCDRAPVRPADAHDAPAHTHGASCSHGHNHPAVPARGPTKTAANAPAATLPSAALLPLPALPPPAAAAPSCAPDLPAVTVAPALQEIIGLTCVTAQYRRVASTRRLPGRYELSPDARQTIATPVAGRLSFVVKPLASVKKGDLLFTIDAPDLTARANEIATLEKRLAVYRTLQTPNAELENTLAVKRAERRALLAGTEEEKGRLLVRAPSDGLVETFDAEEGAWLEQGAGALRLVNPRRLRFKAFVPAAEAKELKDGLAAAVDGYAGTLQQGVGDASGLVPVYLLFRQEIAHPAGARAEATCVVSSAEKPRRAVPSAAIVTRALQPTVFVKDPQNPARFIATPVQPRLEGADWTAVDGLPEGPCTVAVTGVYELKLALPSASAKPAGHFHADGTFHEGEH